MAYFNSDDLFTAEHKVLAETVKACKAAKEAGEPYGNAYYLGMIDGIVALATALTQEDK